MSAACPDKHHRSSLSSLCLLGLLRLCNALIHYHQIITTPAEEVIVEGGEAQCTNTCIGVFDVVMLKRNVE